MIVRFPLPVAAFASENFLHIKILLKLRVLPQLGDAYLFSFCFFCSRFELQDNKPKVDGRMSLEQAVDNSENLTDFLLDFEEDE